MRRVFQPNEREDDVEGRTGGLRVEGETSAVANDHASCDREALPRSLSDIGAVQGS